MEHDHDTIRISRNYLVLAALFLLFLGTGFILLRVIHARGAVSVVLSLAIFTLLFFFVTLLCIFKPYIQVDADRIIVSHDLLRKDILFFYDITRVDFNEEKSICIYHLNGLTRVFYSKFNAFDKLRVISFFKTLETGTHIPGKPGSILSQVK